jgi:serpin B
MSQHHPVDEAALQLSKGNAEFSVALYHRLREQSGNLVFSPYSVSAALAMTYDGARGTTAEQMASVLRFPPDRTSLHAAFSAQLRGLRQVSDGYELSIANALWGQHDFPFAPEFRKCVETFYEACLRSVDFQTEAGREQARRTINEWTANATHGKILEILGKGDLGELTRLVLTNAIYLKGLWETPFAERNSQLDEFHCEDGRKIEVPLMSHVKLEFPYWDCSEFKAMELPYQGGRAGFVMILPDYDLSLNHVERALTARSIEATISKLRRREIQHVLVPRLKLKRRANLNQCLAAMGMSDAFDSLKADFSGMSDQAPLNISQVIHEATLDVDENGVVATGATAVLKLAMTYGPPPITFIANRPFLFLIRDRITGSILFMGRVTDPSEK